MREQAVFWTSDNIYISIIYISIILFVPKVFTKKYGFKQLHFHLMIFFQEIP